MKLIFELMLFGLAIILRRNSKSPLVQAKLRDRSRAAQVRTQDNSVGRYFVFCGGAVFSRHGLLASPDVSLVWKDAAVAASFAVRRPMPSRMRSPTNGFDLRGGLKDVTLMVNAATEQGVHWDFAEMTRRKMTRGVDMGWGQKDWSSVYDVTRVDAGLSV